MNASQQFDRQAAHYNQQWADWNRASLAWLIHHSGAAAHHRLLDVATGTGYTALGFAPLVREVVGLDVSEGMLERARLHGIANARFELGPAERLPYPAASFDLVTSRIAPHHFDSVPAFLAEAHRVLVNGGRLLVADTTVPEELSAWQNEIERWRDPSHVQNYPVDAWRRMVEQAGFTVEAIETLRSAPDVDLNDWLEKAGCRGENAARICERFAQAPAAARAAFQIEGTRFAWLRVGLAARK